MYTRPNSFIESSKKICEKIYIGFSDFLLNRVISKQSIKKIKSGLEEKIERLEIEKSKLEGNIETLSDLCQEKEKKLEETGKELEKLVEEKKEFFKIYRQLKHSNYEKTNNILTHVRAWCKSLPLRKEFMIWLDEENKITHMSPHAKNLLGYLDEDAMGKKYSDLLYEDERKRSFDDVTTKMIELKFDKFNQDNVDIVKKDKKILPLKAEIQFVIANKLHTGSIVYLRKRGWLDHHRTRNEYIITATAKDFRDQIYDITKRMILKGADIEIEGPTKQKIKIPKKIENLKVTIDFKKADTFDEKILDCFNTIGSHLKNNFKIINAHHENVSTPLKTYEDGILEQYLKN